MPYISAALALYGVYQSVDKQQKSKQAIKKLEQFKPKFRTAKDIQTEAELMNPRGFSPEEEANFRQSLSRSNNASYQRATQTNPNLAGAVQSGINYGNVAAISDFAAKDAQLRRQRVDTYANLTRGQSNAQTEADLISKREREIAYGNAKNQADAELYDQLAMLGYAGSKMNFSGGQSSPQTGGTGSAFNGDAPLTSYQNPPVNPNIGSEQWGADLYGNPMGRTNNFRVTDSQFSAPYRTPSPYADSPYITPPPPPRRNPYLTY